MKANKTYWFTENEIYVPTSLEYKAAFYLTPPSPPFKTTNNWNKSKQSVKKEKSTCSTSDQPVFLTAGRKTCAGPSPQQPVRHKAHLCNDTFCHRTHDLCKLQFMAKYPPLSTPTFVVLNCLLVLVSMESEWPKRKKEKKIMHLLWIIKFFCICMPRYCKSLCHCLCPLYLQMVWLSVTIHQNTYFNCKEISGTKNTGVTNI